MNKFQYLKIVVIVLFLVGFTACDHTKLSGEIHTSLEEIIVGDTIQLSLKIPSSLEGIYWVHWEIDPAEAGIITFSKPSEKNKEKDELKKYGHEDRSATFIPLRTGNAKILVYGYFKQTNPQPITSLEILILDNQFNNDLQDQ